MYYCSNFSSSSNETDYERHIILNHNHKIAYPSKTCVEKHNLKPQGKKRKFKLYVTKGVKSF
jgi:hypothetical protein